MADILNSAGKLAKGVDAIANDAYRVQQAVAKTSVTRLTKDQVFQFPVFMDSAIDDDEQYPIIKSIEKNYAQLVMMAITNDGLIDRDRYADVNQFLRRFHNNNGIPAIPYTGGDVRVTEAVATEGALSERDLLALQGTLEDRLDTGSINDMYKPFTVTESKLTRAIEAATQQRRKDAALETDVEYYRQVAWEKDKNGKIITDRDGQPKVLVDRSGKPVYQYFEADPAKKDEMVSKYGNPLPLKEWLKTDADAKARIDFDSHELEREYDRQNQKLRVAGQIGGQVVKDDKFANLAPTVINMTLANIKKDVGAWSQSLVIGVKAVARLIPQSLMVANMVEACKDRAIFKFIKWTNHEVKFVDLLFGINTARADAKAENRWLKVLRKRAKRSRAPGAKINPNTTIIITENDVHYVQEQCGVNLADVDSVRKVMEKYFLLGFGIYDTEGKMLKIIYDGEDEFTQQSMRSLMADAKKEANLLAMSRY